jgi:CRP-like cAMP-binding protein
MANSVLFSDVDARAGFLAALHDDEIETVLSFTQPRRYTTGDVAIKAGEPDRSLFIVTGGRFEVLLPTPDGPMPVSTFQTGDMFGELAFFDNQPRSADVRAIDESEALVMTPAAFERLQVAHPRLALSFVLDLGRVLSMRFRDQNARRAARHPLRDSC